MARVPIKFWSTRQQVPKILEGSEVSVQPPTNGRVTPDWTGAVKAPLANVMRVPVSKRPQQAVQITGPLDLRIDGEMMVRAVKEALKSKWYDAPRNMYDRLSIVICMRPELGQTELCKLADDLDRRSQTLLSGLLNKREILKRTAFALREISKLNDADFFNFLSEEAVPVNSGASTGQQELNADRAEEKDEMNREDNYIDW